MSRRREREAGRPPRSEDGQAIVLGALSMLVLALMVMMSFNLSQAIHEKIRLQQHADATAYSMAVVEARAMNYMAYSNRAMAAGYVAMTSLHAYMAAMSVTSEMFKAGATNFYVFAAIEFGMCSCCGPESPGCCVHCIHGFQAVRNASKHSREARKWANKVKSMDGTFESTVRALDRAIDGIHASQLAVLASTAVVLGKGLDDLKKNNAPQASNVSAGVGALNVMEMACALEGVPLLSCSSRTETPLDTRKKVMTEVANATRPSWPANRGGLGFPAYLSFQFLQSLMQDVPDQLNVPLMEKGTAKMVRKGAHSSATLESTTEGEDGGTCGADEHGKLFSLWKYHGLPMISGYSAGVYSDSGDGSHEPGNAHSGRHDFEGVDAKDTCLMQGNCFVKFRPSTKRDEDYGQPHVYAYVTQDLRVDASGHEGPWEVNETGEVTIEHGAQGTATLKLAPGRGAALSKALVYYHRLGDWHEHPNLFNPYWRAKLHPLEAKEAAKVLAAAADTDAAMLAGVAPVN